MIITNFKDYYIRDFEEFMTEDPKIFVEAQKLKYRIWILPNTVHVRVYQEATDPLGKIISFDEYESAYVAEF
jgi:hypothetical protein